MHSLIKILLCFLWLTCFNVCYMYDLQRQSQRLDDLEIELLNEGKHRRADIFELREKVEKLESFLKSNSVGEYTPGTTGQENKSENDLTPLGSKFLRECPSMYQSLLTGFKVEKALNVRARRHMTEIDAALTSLQQNTRTAVTDNMEILKVGITRVENTSSEILTNTRQLASHTEKLPQLTDGVEKVKTLLDNYIQNVSRPRSCSELLQRGHTSSGLYKVYPGTWTEGIQVFCDQESDGGGWTVFQRREDGFLDFYRGWLDYKLGFGSLLGEFWLGNEYIHYLTADCCHELRVELVDFKGNQRHAKYSNFKVGPKSSNYILSVIGYTGDGGDSLDRHNGASFSTKDNEHSGSCCVRYKGGWWYENCHDSNLNGLYLNGDHTTFADGVNWKSWTGYHYSLKFVEMKFRERE